MARKELLVIVLFFIIIIVPMIYKFKFSKKEKHAVPVELSVPKSVLYHRYREVKEASILLLENVNNSTFFCKLTKDGNCIVCRDNMGNILVIPVHGMIKCQGLCPNCRIKYKLFYYFVNPLNKALNTNFLNVINNTTVSDLKYLSYFIVSNDCITIGYKITDSSYTYILIVCRNPKDLKKIVGSKTRIVQKICGKNYCGLTLSES